MSATHNRTFDCPWCGAISPVPADHLGEHFTCSECKKGTKLTEKNTTNRKPTDAPPDAPHLTGDRTFDCPWCGAISSLDSSHLGERYRCDECNKETKLTGMNTRRAPITAPPPDAPPPAPRPLSPMTKGILAAVVLAVGGVGGWWFMRDKGGESSDGASSGTTEVGGGPSTGPDATGPDGSTPPDGATPPDGSTPPDPMAPTPAVPAPPDDAGMGVVGPPPPALEEARLALAAATARRATALEKQYAALAALEDWKAANANVAVAAENVGALREVAAEAQRLTDEKKLIPDPEKPTLAQVRAYDAALVAFTSASPSRAKAAEQVLAWLRADPFGREGHGLAGWNGLNFAGEGVRRAFRTLEDVWAPHASLWPVDLAKAAADATAEGTAAQKAVLDAEARVAAAQGGK